MEETLKRLYWHAREISNSPKFYTRRYLFDIPRAVLARWRREKVALGEIKIQLGQFASLRIAVEILNGEYEADERELLRAHLADDDIVVELGTALGVIAALCAKRVGSKNVFTFEANPAMITHAQTTFRLNEVDPLIENCMVSSRSGQETFYISKHFWSSSSKSRGEAEKEVIVPVMPLGAILEKYRPTFLIVDIEGGEADLFDGISLPSFVQRILIELHPHVIGQESVNSVLRQLKSMGFSPQMRMKNPNQMLLARA